MGQSSGRLRVEIADLRNDEGHVLGTLYDGPEGFPRDSDKACRSGRVEIRDRQAAFEFEGLSPGRYAVALLHDENDDGKLNTNRLGIPTEGIGLSNVEKLKLKVPTFEDAAFDYTGGDQTVIVKVLYLL